MKKTIFTVIASVSVFASTSAMAQYWPMQTESRHHRPVHVHTNPAQPEFDPYQFCYYENRAYSEGTHLKDVGKCQLKENPDTNGKHRLYWENDFYKQNRS